MEYLINEDGEPFTSTELKLFADNLDSLSDEDRVAFRNDNALEISQHSSSKILIVSGPGPGKSTLFQQ